MAASPLQWSSEPLRIATALALAMPSHNETFGMVYPEALLAGVPILFSSRTAIDGYFDGLNVGIGVDQTEVQAIAVAHLGLVNDNAKFGEQIAQYCGTIFEPVDTER
jgi:glycosyltransferase involved in cell wall biosynthesis